MNKPRLAQPRWQVLPYYGLSDEGDHPRLVLAKLAKPRWLIMQVNMLDAKSQLSRLVKAALAGEDVINCQPRQGPGEVGAVPIGCRLEATWRPGGGQARSRASPAGCRLQ